MKHEFQYMRLLETIESWSNCNMRREYQSTPLYYLLNYDKICILSIAQSDEYQNSKEKVALKNKHIQGY